MTNATWNDFWLNEGFTTYFEGRIMEAVYGRPYSDMLAVLGRQDLRRRDQGACGDRQARTPASASTSPAAIPDEGTSDIAYEKGALFLRTLEASVGREKLRPLPAHLLRHLRLPVDGLGALRPVPEAEPPGRRPGAGEKLQIDAWVYGPGVPANAAKPHSDAFVAVDQAVQAFTAGTPAAQLPTTGWTTHHWLHFLRNLPEAARRAEDGRPRRHLPLQPSRETPRS